jgi:hypothetical protein
MLRPSISTSILLAVEMLNPRAEMPHVSPLKRATSTPVASLRASGSSVMPARRMSSEVTTLMAAGASKISSECFDTLVTSMRDRSSIDTPRSVWAGSSSPGSPEAANAGRVARQLRTQNAIARKGLVTSRGL